MLALAFSVAGGSLVESKKYKAHRAQGDLEYFQKEAAASLDPRHEQVVSVSKNKQKLWMLPEDQSREIAAQALDEQFYHGATSNYLFSEETLRVFNGADGIYKPGMNPEAFIILKTDIAELRQVNYMLDTEEERALLNGFEKKYFGDADLAFLNSSTEELAAYNAAKKRLYKTLNIENMAFSQAGRQLIRKEILENIAKISALAGVFFVGLVMAQNAHGEEVTRLAQNMNLAFKLDPRSPADAAVLDAADNVPLLRDELIKQFDAVHDFASLPGNDEKTAKSLLLKQQKEKSKEINFGKLNKEQTQTGILNEYTGGDLRLAK